MAVKSAAAKLTSGSAGTGGRATATNGQPEKTVIGDVEFGTVVSVRPKLATGEGKGRQPLPMDDATLFNLNTMFDNGVAGSVNWRGTNLEFRQKVEGTFAKWAKARKIDGTLRLRRNLLAISQNKISVAKADNDKEIMVNYYIETIPDGADVTVKA